MTTDEQFSDLVLHFTEVFDELHALLKHQYLTFGGTPSWEEMNIRNRVTSEAGEAVERLRWSQTAEKFQAAKAEIEGRIEAQIKSELITPLRLRLSEGAKPSAKTGMTPDEHIVHCITEYANFKYRIGILHAPNAVAMKNYKPRQKAEIISNYNMFGRTQAEMAKDITHLPESIGEMIKLVERDQRKVVNFKDKVVKDEFIVLLREMQAKAKEVLSIRSDIDQAFGIEAKPPQPAPAQPYKLHHQLRAYRR